MAHSQTLKELEKRIRGRTIADADINWPTVPRPVEKFPTKEEAEAFANQHATATKRQEGDPTQKIPTL
ncbi:hypothetical protein GQ600_17943 [Phytophthora cactorum]|nr:hypothetical protein GQ600_17943 [Phytophthora cactorum]